MDRTAEFRQLVEGAQREAPLGQPQPGVPRDSSGFREAAADIAKGIHRCSQILGKLTELVRRQGLYEDSSDEINELIFRIKEDIASLDRQLDSAQQYVDSKKRQLGEKNQSATHNVKVVSQLKTNLMQTTQQFKGVLELRSNKMKEQQHRRAALTGTRKIGALVPAAPPNMFYSPYDLPKDQSSDGSSSLVLDMEDGRALQQQQQQALIAAPQTEYYQQREQAINEVEAVIRQLGQMFQQLSTMLAAQAELAERIDADIEATQEYTNKGLWALTEAYKHAQSNKALYTKILAVVAAFLVFFLLFVL